MRDRLALDLTEVVWIMCTLEMKLCKADRGKIRKHMHSF